MERITDPDLSCRIVLWRGSLATLTTSMVQVNETCLEQGITTSWIGADIYSGYEEIMGLGLTQAIKTRSGVVSKMR
jgi:hypothetical protein